MLNNWKSHDNDIHFSNERQENEKKNVGKRCKKNIYKLHKPDEKVFICLHGKGKDSLKKHQVLIGKIQHI